MQDLLSCLRGRMWNVAGHRLRHQWRKGVRSLRFVDPDLPWTQICSDCTATSAFLGAFRGSNLPLRQLELQRISVKAQEPGGFASIPAHALEHAKNRLPLELLAGLLE